MIAHMSHVMTLANSIIGVGILAMPFCFQKCGIVLSIVLLIVSNWITRICCHYLIKSSLLTRRKSFEYLGFHTFGASGKLLVELCIIGYLLGTCITSFVVVGDLGPQIIGKMFTLNSEYIHLRTIVMIAVTLLCVLPLGMLKNVDSLSTVCTASIGFYVCLVIKIILESEEHILANDWTTNVVYWEPAGVLQCLPIFSMALSCQMQLFEVFEGINNQSMEKLNGIVRDATWICTFVYIAVGIFGYVAYCTQPFSGNILLNLSTSFGSDVIKVGFVLSVAFSFPLVIFPCRASIYSLIYRKGHVDITGYIPDTRFKVITIFIVIFSLCIALVIPSVELIIGLVGSTIGVAICIMFPASSFRKIVKKDSTERTMAQFILISGFCLMILGTYANLGAIDEKNSGAHLEKIENENIILSVTEPPRHPNIKIELLENNLKNGDSKLYKVEDSNTVQKKNNQLQKELILDKSLDTLHADKSEAPAPPLPVDEKHEEDVIFDNEKDKIEKKEQSENLKPAASVPKQVEEVPYVINKTNVKPAPAEVKTVVLNEVVQKSSTMEAKPDISRHKDNDNKLIKSQKQSIDNEAIKKDDDIAAEELKISNDELKETQAQLKKAQEMIERTVDELNELKKQNTETKNLVQEKIGEVVEKVEEIERKVQQTELKEQEIIKSKEQEIPLSDTAKDDVAALKDQVNKTNSLLLNILTENTKGEANAGGQNPSELKPVKAEDKVSKLSNNDSNVESRLSLPLPLLLNVTQAKTNDNLAVDTAPKQDSNAEIKQADSLNKIESKQTVLPREVIKNEIPRNNVVNESIKENVEAIRRELLQIDEIKDINSTLNPESQRAKRSIDTENYLKAPKEDTLLSPGLSSAIQFKMQGISNEVNSMKQHNEN